MAGYGRKRVKGFTVAKKAKRRTVGKTVKVSPAVKNYINKQIVKKAEPKSNANSLNNQNIQIYNAGTQTLTVYDCRAVFTTCLQSAGQGGRIGNQLNVTKFDVYGFIQVAGSPILSNVYIKLIMMRVKEDNISPNGLFNQLFQFGNNTVGPVGNLLDMMRAFNKDYFTIYATKTILLGSSDSTTSALAMNNSIGNYMFRFNLMKVFGGKILFNDNTLTPTNKACYLVYLPCNADGTVITAGQIAPYLTTINTEMVYTDD